MRFWPRASIKVLYLGGAYCCWNNRSLSGELVVVGNNVVPKIPLKCVWDHICMLMGMLVFFLCVFGLQFLPMLVLSALLLLPPHI